MTLQKKTWDKGMAQTLLQRWRMYKHSSAERSVFHVQLRRVYYTNTRKGGVYFRHGAQRKRCSYEGCTNHAQKGGVYKKERGKGQTIYAAGKDAHHSLS